MRAYDFRYIFTNYKPKGILFRARIYLAERLVPQDLNNYGREKIIGYISKGGIVTKRRTDA